MIHADGARDADAVQLTVNFDGPDPCETIQHAFERFHAANPRVYDILVRLARQAVDKGHKKIGIGMLYEVLRWEIFLETSDDKFKLPNNFRSRYARLIMAQELDLAGMFRTARLRSE